MKLTPAGLVERLAALGAKDTDRIILAFSGGLDSTVLLDLVARSPARSRLAAVHVNHGISASADAWAEHCVKTCDAASIELSVIRVDVADGASPEAAAREARYAAFEGLIGEGDCLLTAHHRDDQAETLILNLMRASGPLGLAGIPERRALGGGSVLRPLLSVPRASLLDYARRRELRWIDDDSNSDIAFDRNFLRHELLPLLESRFDSASARLSRSSELMAEAAELLDELAAGDLAACGGDARRLALGPLRRLSTARQRNLLRYSLRSLGRLPPGGPALDAIVSDLVTAREDAQPVVASAGLSFRRFRDTLYVLDGTPPPPPRRIPLDRGLREIDLGAGLGALCFDESAEGIDARLLDAPAEIRFRQGGETLRIRGSTRPLKKLLQEASVVPWMRNFVPLLYADGEIVAAGDLWIDERALARPGLAVGWKNPPPLY